MSLSQWLLLVTLSVLWGGSFLFVGIAVEELPAFTIVMVRVVLAALLMVPLILALGFRLPTTLSGWWPFLVMALFNNVLPFSAIVLGQKEIASGLASVLNATTPLFAITLTHVLTGDKMSARSVVGVLIGAAGVAILMGPAVFGSDRTSVLGMALVLFGACAYGISSVWGRRLRQSPPLVSATAQLLCSSLIMALLAGVIDRPWNLAVPSTRTLLALVALATLSTALAYAIFFRILAVSGATNVMLVTLLIPISGIALGAIVLAEPLLDRHILGALVIASGLVVIDGRLLTMLRARALKATALD